MPSSSVGAASLIWTVNGVLVFPPQVSTLFQTELSTKTMPQSSTSSTIRINFDGSVAQTELHFTNSKDLIHNASESMTRGFVFPFFSPLYFTFRIV